jgi:hypothetical protein
VLLSYLALITTPVVVSPVIKDGWKVASLIPFWISPTISSILTSFLTSPALNASPAPITALKGCVVLFSKLSKNKSPTGVPK